MIIYINLVNNHQSRFFFFCSRLNKLSSYPIHTHRDRHCHLANVDILVWRLTLANLSVLICATKHFSPYKFVDEKRFKRNRTENKHKFWFFWKLWRTVSKTYISYVFHSVPVKYCSCGRPSITDIESQTIPCVFWQKRLCLIVTWDLCYVVVWTKIYILNKSTSVFLSDSCWWLKSSNTVQLLKYGMCSSLLTRQSHFN